MKQQFINRPRTSAHGASSLLARVAMLLLAVFMMPQKVAASDDYQAKYAGRDYSINSDQWGQYVLFRVTYWDDYGTDEGWCDSNGL